MIGREQHRAVGADEQRVAVGRRLREGLARDQAAGAGLVLDDEWLAQLLLQFVGDDARRAVDIAAGRIGHDQANVSRRIWLGGGRRSGKGREYGDANAGHSACEKSHRILPKPVADRCPPDVVDGPRRCAQGAFRAAAQSFDPALYLSTKLWRSCPHGGQRTLRRCSLAGGTAAGRAGDPARACRAAHSRRRAGGGRALGGGRAGHRHSTRPTVHRIVHVLIEEGIVERHEQDRLLRDRRPGARARAGASVALASCWSRQTTCSRQLRRELGDTLFLTVRTGNDTLCVDRRIGSYPIQVLSIEVGARRPLGVSSAGVAILAAMPAQEARKIVAANETRFDGLPHRCSDACWGRSQPRGAAATTCARSASCRARNRFPPGSRQRTISPVAAITLSAVRTRLGPRREVGTGGDPAGCGPRDRAGDPACNGLGDASFCATASTL